MGRASKHHHQEGQLELFVCLVEPTGQGRSRARRRTSAPLARTQAILIVQLDIDFDPDDELVKAPIIHAWVKAAEAPPPKTRAPRSIFELAASQVIAEAMGRRLRTPPARRTIQQTPHKMVVRDGDVLRCTRLHHTDTEEWQVKEAARRARQKVPKPPKKAKTISRKLSELIGD